MLFYPILVHSTFSDKIKIYFSQHCTSFSSYIGELSTRTQFLVLFTYTNLDYYSSKKKPGGTTIVLDVRSFHSNPTYSFLQVNN
jgi:hypothetical protein